MGGGTWQGGEGGKKRVSVTEIDDLLYLHAQSSFGDAPDAERGESPDAVDLGYPLAHAFDLWMAWKEKGVMPRRGGYEDQPRRWLRMIRFLNRRYAVAYDLAKAEHVPDRDNGGVDDEADIMQGFMSQVSPFEAGERPRPSWERFGQ